MQKASPGYYRDRRVIDIEDDRCRIRKRPEWLREGPTAIEVAAVSPFVHDFELRLELLDELITAVEMLHGKVVPTEVTGGDQRRAGQVHQPAGGAPRRQERQGHPACERRLVELPSSTRARGCPMTAEVTATVRKAHDALDEVGDLLEIAHLALRNSHFGDSGSDVDSMHTLVEVLEQKVVAVRLLLNEVVPHVSRHDDPGEEIDTSKLGTV